MSDSGDVIFLVGEDGLMEMRSELFASEDDLQDLVARYPDLLAGAQMTPGDPRRWMLIRREMGVPSREGGGGHWSADHLFVDQDGVPTIVEVKRSTDTRIRREVVGQMLDYAANAVRYWPVEDLRATHEAACLADGRDPVEALLDLVGPEVDADAFWTRVGQQLASGRIRMVFVADMVPPELQRIVEFLNEGMSRAQVYAVELPQFVGAGQRSLVPRLIGATSTARQSAGRDRATPNLDALLADASEDVRTVDARLREWAAQRGHVVRDTRKARHFSADGVSLGLFYPGDEQLELYLEPIRKAGLTQEADGLFTELGALSRSKALTAKMPMLAAADLLANWDPFVGVLDRYADTAVTSRQRRQDQGDVEER